MTSSVQPQQRPRVSTGVEGLDQILGGGVPSERLYLVHGGPGTGKTTFGFQFLLKGVECGESALYISLLLGREELEDVMASHGWSLDSIQIAELPEEVREAAAAGQSIFSPAEVELGEVTDAIIDIINEHQPDRVVVDSISELSMLVESPYQLRRQLIKMRQSLRNAASTTLLISGEAIIDQLPTLQTIVHGSFHLELQAPAYGMTRRCLCIDKVRGVKFSGGYHDFRIRTGGLEVFARLTPPAECKPTPERVVPSGNEGLDELLGGGLSEGTNCLIVGTSGSGKSTLASLFARSVVARQERVAFHCFDESTATLVHRSRNLGLGLHAAARAGQLLLQEHEIGSLTPGRFTDAMRRDVESRGVKAVVIDSFTGFLNVMPYEENLLIHLHEMLSYLSKHGVLTLVTQGMHGLTQSDGLEVDTSYLVDTVVLMRHFETMGSIRRCISVLKKRHGRHEAAIREVDIVEGGLRVGPPLRDFSGVLTGVPRFVGEREELLTLSEEGD